MKKYCLILTVLVLTLSLLTGCGCSPQKESEPALPTRDTSPMVPDTLVPTTPSEEATTLPESMPGDSGMSGAEGEAGNGGQSGGQNGGQSGGQTGGQSNGQTGGQKGGSGTTGGMTDSTTPSGGDMARGRGMR